MLVSRSISVMSATAAHFRVCFSFEAKFQNESDLCLTCHIDPLSGIFLLCDRTLVGAASPTWIAGGSGRTGAFNGAVFRHHAREQGKSNLIHPGSFSINSTAENCSEGP